VCFKYEKASRGFHYLEHLTRNKPIFWATHLLSTDGEVSQGWRLVRSVTQTAEQVHVAQPVSGEKMRW
jgi:hypothetical protein